jgi:hypothetical protein
MDPKTKTTWVEKTFGGKYVQKGKLPKNNNNEKRFYEIRQGMGVQDGRKFGLPSSYGWHTREQEHQEGTPLAWEECEAVKDIYFNNIPVKLASQAFKSKIFENAFDVYYGNKNTNTSYPIKSVLKHTVIKKYWIPFLRNVHDWLKMFGLCPFYYKEINLSKNLSNPVKPASNKRKREEAKNRVNSKKGNKKRKFNKNKVESEDEEEEEDGNDEEVGDKNGEEEDFGGEFVDTEDTHLVPITPPMESGRIYTYMHKKEQRFYWKWDNTTSGTHPLVGQEDGSVYFIVRDPPSLFGGLRSAMSCLVKDHVQLEILREIEASVALSHANPLHVIEYAPSLKDASEIAEVQDQRNPREPAPSRMSGWADLPPEPTPSTRLQSITNSRKDYLNMDSASSARTPFRDLGLPDLYGGGGGGGNGFFATPQNLSPATRYNTLNNLRRLKAASFDIDGSYESLSIEQRALVANTNKIMLLEPYEKYVNAAQPSLDTSLSQRLVERLDRLASACVDFPLSLMIDNLSASSGNGQTALTFFESRVKSETGFYSDIVKEIFSAAYAYKLGEARTNSKRLLLNVNVVGNVERFEMLKAMLHNMDIQIMFPRTPIKTIEEIMALYQHRMIDEKTSYEFVMDNMGLNFDALEPPKECKEALQRLYPLPQTPDEEMEREITMQKKTAAIQQKMGASGVGSSGKPSSSSTNTKSLKTDKPTKSSTE